MSLIIDPLNPDIALVDGRLAAAVRVGAVANPETPTTTELLNMPIIGYGTVSRTEKSN